MCIVGAEVVVCMLEAVKEARLPLYVLGVVICVLHAVGNVLYICAGASAPYVRQ